MPEFLEKGDVLGWLVSLGVEDRATGIQQAAAHRQAISRKAYEIASESSDLTIAGMVLLGFAMRAEGLHVGTVDAITADNPHAAFTTLCAYSENMATLLYAMDNPDYVESLAGGSTVRSIPISEVIRHTTE